MSRSPLSGDVITFSKEGADARLKIHIGPKPRSKPWPIVEEPNAPPAPKDKEIVLEMQPLARQPEPTEGLHGWSLALGYSLFGVSLALSNLLTLPHTPLVCSLACPVPMLCLWAQAFAVGLSRRSVAVILACCAFPVPLVCSLWSLFWGAPFIVFLAGVQAIACRHWGGALCLVLTLASLSLAFSRIPGLEPKWGVTLSVFFLVAGCVLASLCAGRVVFRVRYIV